MMVYYQNTQNLYKLHLEKYSVRLKRAVRSDFFFFFFLSARTVTGSYKAQVLCLLWLSALLINWLINKKKRV